MRRIIPFVDGRPLTEVGPWEQVKYSHGWPYGSLRASWKMDPIRHPSLYWGASVVLTLFGIPIWRGFLNEPGRDGQMSALGLWEQAKGCQTLNASASTTAEPRDAVAQGISRGALRWSSPVPDIYPGAAAQQMDAPYPAQSVAALLDYVADLLGVRWYIDAFTGALATAADPTDPTWLIPSQVAGLGLTPADDSVATHLIGEYLVSPGVRAPVTAVSPDYVAGAPVVERRVDLISKGFINSTQALGYLTAMFGKSVGKVGWADGFQLDRSSVTTIGGASADPALIAVAVGQGTMLRSAGVWDDRQANPLGYTDVIAAEGEYDEETDAVSIKPIGLETRTIGEVMTWVA